MGECGGNLMERFVRAVAATNTRVLRADLRLCRGRNGNAEGGCCRPGPDESRYGGLYVAGRVRGEPPEFRCCCIAFTGFL